MVDRGGHVQENGLIETCQRTTGTKIFVINRQGGNGTILNPGELLGGCICLFAMQCKEFRRLVFKDIANCEEQAFGAGATHQTNRQNTIAANREKAVVQTDPFHPGQRSVDLAQDGFLCGSGGAIQRPVCTT